MEIGFLIYNKDKYVIEVQREKKKFGIDRVLSFVELGEQQRFVF